MNFNHNMREPAQLNGVGTIRREKQGAADEMSKSPLNAAPPTNRGRLSAVPGPWCIVCLLMLWAASTFAQGVLINGGNHTGAISTANQQDSWTFDAQAGDHLFLRVSQTTGGTSFAPRIRVFDSTSLLVGTASGAASSSTSSARLDYVAGSSGAFTLVVDAGPAGGTGSYRVDFVRLPGVVTVPSSETGGPLDNEARTEGAIALGDLDAWTFSADAGDLVELRAAELSGGNGFVPRVRVFDSTGHEVGDASGASSSSTSEARFSFRPSTTNTFTVVVDSSTPEGTGGYRLHLLKLPATVTVPASDTGGPLTSGGNQDGSITLGDLDAWTFDAAAGDKVFLRAAQTSGDTGFAPRIRVYDPDGLLVASASDTTSSSSSEARAEYIPSTAGTFTVVVDSSLVEGTGGYRLFYLKVPGSFVVPSGDDGGALASGDNDASTTLGDLDVWTFDANTGDRVTLSLSEMSGGTSYSPRARIFEPSGELVAYAEDPVASNSSSNSVTLIVPTNGTFSVVIDSSLVQGSGNYRLNYALETGPFTPPTASGTLLVNGGNHDGSISVGSSNKWTFGAVAGNSVLLRIGQRSGGNGFDPRMRLYDPNGDLVASANEGYGSTGASDAQLSVIAALSGTYTVVVDSAFANGAGDYRLYYLNLPGEFTVPGGDQGGALANGGNHDGTIDVGDLDAWTFDAAAGDSVLLRIGQRSGGNGFDPRLRLYDPHGELVASAAEGYGYTGASDAQLSVIAALSGTYTVVVDSGFVRGAGDYRLYYLKVPGAFMVPGGDQGGALANGGNHDGTIDVGDLDTWTFDAAAGDSVLLRIGQLTGGDGFDPRLRLYDPHGELVASAAEGYGYTVASDAQLSVIAALSGTYTVVVDSGFTSGSGDYRLYYLEVPGAFTVPGGDQGGALANGGNHDGTIDVADLDAWTFDAAAGESVLLRVGQISGGNGFDPRLRLYDPNGDLIASAAEGYAYTGASDAQLSVIAALSGTYTVVVDSGFTSGSGDYRLYYLKVPGAFMVPGGDQGGAMVNGGNSDGTIDVGDLDAWTFDATAGDNVLLRIGQLSGGNGFDPRLRLYDPHGDWVASAAEGYAYTGASDAELRVIAALSGTYTVVVDSGSTSGSGDYRLHYLRVPGAFTVPPGDDGGALTKDATNDAVITIGDLDVWSFAANQGNNIMLTMQTASGFSPSLEVYGPTGQLIASKTHASLAQVSFVAPDSGIFIVVASSGTVRGTGAYQLTNAGLPEQQKQLRFALLQPGSFTVNWPSAWAAYVLQQNDTLDPNGWQDVTAPASDNGLNVRLIMPMDKVQQFFRLRPPT